MCPQCLSDIDLDGFEQVASNNDYHEDDEETIDSRLPQDDNTVAAAQASTAEQHSPSSTQATQPPAYNNEKQHTDDVMRYCKNCGTFLRQGVNFCPKCGKYVKVVAPPAYQGSAHASKQPPKYSRPAAGKPSQPNTKNHRNRVNSQHMATNTRKPSKTTSKNDNNRPKGILAIPGCLIFTVIIVALFFIVYILWGGNFDGLTTN